MVKHKMAFCPVFLFMGYLFLGFFFCYYSFVFTKQSSSSNVEDAGEG